MVKYVSVLLLTLFLGVLLVPSPAEASIRDLEWNEVDKPGTTGYVVVSPSEVNEIAVGSGGFIYAIDSKNSKVYHSSNAGSTWEDITPGLVSAGAGLPATKIVVAPDKRDTIAVVTDAGTGVYLSTDGGTEWTDTRVPGLTGTIQAITMSKQYTETGMSVREIAIGTAVWGDATTTGQLWVLQTGKSWQDQSLVIDPNLTGGEVSAIAYVPNYRTDRKILVIASTSEDVASDYQSQTWLCIGSRSTAAGTTSWNTITGYPVAIASTSSPLAGDASGVSQITSSLVLPSDYASTLDTSRRVFVSYDREPDTDGNNDVYRVDDITPYRLNANHGNAVELSSLAYYGTVLSGKLLAGDENAVTGSKTVPVRRTDDPFDTSPTWELATVPPSGPGNAKVSWSTNGEIAYCGTGQSTGGTTDESAFSSSVDGDSWQQLSLIDTVVKFSDIAISPDSKTLFAATYSASGPEGIWRTTVTRLGLGEFWTRQLTLDTTFDRIIIRLSPDYLSGDTIYVAEVGGDKIAVSNTRGNSWHWRHALGSIVDMAAGDKGTIYTALPNGRITKSPDGARTWRNLGDVTLSDINMLVVAGSDTLLVGSRDGRVAYSTNGGDSFTRISEVIGNGTGDVQVIADVNYPENNIIYAATNIPDEGIWRWLIESSTRWEQIDRSITDLGNGQCISGLVISSEGMLYALRLEAASSTSGGMTRAANPAAPDNTKVEFDFANSALPDGTTFDPNAVFTHTMPSLRLSGDSEQSKLWAVDTASEIIYQFQDSLSVIGPALDMPAEGAIIPVSSSGYTESFSLNWEELPETTTYEAAIYLDSAGTEKVWSGTSSTTGIIPADGASPPRLSSGTTYYWRVRSLAPIISPWSEMRSFTPALEGGEWSPLATITGVAPSPGASNILIRPAFTWNSAAGASGYEFVLAKDSGFTDVVVAMLGKNALPINAWGCDRDLDYATTYFWRVRAISDTAQSGWGTAVFTTGAAPAVTTTPQSSPSPTPSPSPPPSAPLPSATPASESLVPLPLLWLGLGIGTVLVMALIALVVRTRG